MVNDDGTARGQLHRACIGRFNLVLNLETAEQRCIVAVTLHTRCKLWHDMAHELLSLIVDVVGVDQDVADVAVEVIANGTNDQAGFLVNQEGAFGTLRGAVNGGPQLEQIVQVPLQFRCAATNASGAGNDGHPFGIFQLVHGFFEFCAVVAFNATANATTAWVVGHEDHIASGQTDESGQGSALVATFFFFHLHQKLLAFANHIVDAGLANRYAFGEKLAGDFFERQEAVSLFAVVNEAGFKRWLDTCDDRLVDVAFALFAAFNFNFVVEEFLSVDDGQAAFFSLCGVDQHPFHDASLLFNVSANQAPPNLALGPDHLFNNQLLRSQRCRD